MPTYQQWFRALVIVTISLIIYHSLCIQMTEAKRFSKNGRKNYAINPTRPNKQQRRQKIIKCCGKGSCINIVSKLRNSSQLSTKPTMGKNTLVTKIDTQLPSQPFTSRSTSSTKPDESDEMTEIANPALTSTSETINAETSTETDVTITLATTTTSSSVTLGTSTTEFTMPETSSTSYTRTSTSSTSSTSTTTTPTSISKTTETSTSTTTKASTTTTTTTTSTTTKPLLPGVSLFEPDGVLKDKLRYGSWREVCGELYLFGKSLVKWDENIRRCCNLGMLPIAFETANQFNCMLDVSKTENWPYNMNYWTSGRRIHSNGTFQWCLSNKTSYLANSGFMWAAQQPDNQNGSQSCVHFSIPRNQNRTELTDRNCNDTYVFACKGSTTPAPKCHTPVCPFGTCKKNDTFYTIASDKKTKFLKDAKVHGTWTNVNNRIYVFSNTSATWQEAANACCAIGTKILSVDNDYEYEMLSAAIGQSKGAVAPGLFWTSATDEGCEGTFGWCAVTKLVRGAIWANGKPGIGNRCVAADVDLTNTTLKTSDCSAKLKYICETRDTGTASTGGRAMQDECAAVYNLSSAELDTIFNTTKYSRKTKCFLKCMGENGGYFVNGHLVDESLIKMAEMFSSDNIEQLQKDLAAIEACSNIKGMDECDTVALTFQCGQEKAPVLLANAITSVELSASSELETSPLQPSLGACITDYPCVVNPSKEQAFAAGAALSDGFHEILCGKKYFASSNPVILALCDSQICALACLKNKICEISIFLTMTFRAAASKCCEYGLSLVSLDSPSELGCLVNGNLGGATRPYHIWTSGSRLGTDNAFRWCSSKAPLNVSYYNWQRLSYTMLELSAVTIKLFPTLTDTELYMGDPEVSSVICVALCEEQPLI